MISGSDKGGSSRFAIVSVVVVGVLDGDGKLYLSRVPVGAVVKGVRIRVGSTRSTFLIDGRAEIPLSSTVGPAVIFEARTESGGVV